MKINVGEMIHDLRAERLPKGSLCYKIGDYAANNLQRVEKALRPVLTAAGSLQTLVGDSGVRSIGKAMHKLGLPQWTPALPGAHYSGKHTLKCSKKKVVYFPSCINQTTVSYTHLTLPTILRV